MERTLIIVKPDGVDRNLVGEILSRFERKNLRISHLKMTVLDRKVVEAHYAHLNDKPFFGELVDFMVSSKVVLGVIEGEDAVTHVRNIMGKTKAVEATPGTIRGDYALTTQENLVHGSDSIENAEIEIRRFFSELF